MKHFTKIIPALCLLLSCGLMGPVGETLISLETNTAQPLPDSTQKQLSRSLSMRLEHMTREIPQIEMGKGAQIHIRIPGQYAQEAIVPALLQKGELHLTETQPWTYAYPILNEINTRLAEMNLLNSDDIATMDSVELLRVQNPLYAHLNVFPAEDRDPYNPYVGQVLATDTAQINAWLAMEEIAQVIPLDISFAWDWKPIPDTGDSISVINLAAIKHDFDGEYVGLRNVVFESAYAETTDYGDNAVMMKFDPANTTQWADLTRKNTDRFIAMIMDGKILSLPRVNEAITSGQTMISGSMTGKEAGDIAAIMQAGALPIGLSLVAYEVKGKQD